MEEFISSFTGTSDGHLIPKNKEDFRKFLIENAGIELVGKFIHTVKQTEKERLYNFFHGPILQSYVDAYEDAGYNGVTKAHVEDMLKNQFAFELYTDLMTHKEMRRPLSKKDFSKARLVKFIKDCLYYLEIEIGWECPDSEEYLRMKDDVDET